MNRTEQIEFQIKAIELLDSSISAPDKPFSGNRLFQFDISVEHRISLEKRLIKVICSVTVHDESKETRFGNIRTSCTYEIQDLPKYYNKKEKRFDLPEQIITSLNTISISTTRGVMFSFFSGTFLHNAVLPVINPKEF